MLIKVEFSFVLILEEIHFIVVIYWYDEISKLTVLISAAC